MGILLILAAFGATRWGGDYLQRVIVYFVIMGFKLIGCYFLFALGIRMMSYMIISMHFSGGLMTFISSLMTTLGITMVMSFLFHRLPAAMPNYMGGSPVMTAGQLIDDMKGNLSMGGKTLSAMKAGGKFAAKHSGLTKAFSNAKTKASAAAFKKKRALQKAGGTSNGMQAGALTALQKMGALNKVLDHSEDKTKKLFAKQKETAAKVKKNKKAGAGSTVLGGNGAQKALDFKGAGGAKNSKSGTAKADLSKALSGVASKDASSTGNFMMPSVKGPGDD